MGAENPGLSIYGYSQCPYCARVLRAVDSLGLEVEFRDTMRNPDYRRDLSEATGRTTVPVLRIESEEGQVEWLPESTDIVAYLEDLAVRESESNSEGVRKAPTRDPALRDRDARTE